MLAEPPNSCPACLTGTPRNVSCLPSADISACVCDKSAVWKVPEVHLVNGYTEFALGFFQRMYMSWSSEDAPVGFDRRSSDFFARRYCAIFEGHVASESHGIGPGHSRRLVHGQARRAPRSGSQRSLGSERQSDRQHCGLDARTWIELTGLLEAHRGFRGALGQRQQLL